MLKGVGLLISTDEMLVYILKSVKLMVYSYTLTYTDVIRHLVQNQGVTHGPVQSSVLSAQKMSQSAFTALDLSLCNKELDVQITISHWENESRRFIECEPLRFSLKAPAFHRPCELDFHIKSTTSDFRNIFSKGLLESFLLLKLSREKWKKLITDYESYLKEK